jgi:non-homologous end joining protein Ku
MNGDHHLLAVTTTTDEVSNEVKPLFGFPVQICKATQDVDAKFDVAAPSGAPREQVYRDTATSEVHADDECPRGVRISDDDFRVIPDEAITEAKGRKSNMIVAEGSMPLADVDFTRAKARYFVQSPVQGGSAKSYRLVCEGLREVRKSKRVMRPARALTVKRTPRTNEQLGVIYYDETQMCLMFVALHFAGELRQPDEAVLAPQQAEVAQKQIDVVRQVIDALPDGSEFLATTIDENVPVKRDLIEKALDGVKITAPTPVAATVETDNLEAALEASLAALA